MGAQLYIHKWFQWYKIRLELVMVEFELLLQIFFRVLIKASLQQGLYSLVDEMTFVALKKLL